VPKVDLPAPSWFLLGLLALVLLIGIPMHAPGVVKAYDWGLQIAWIERFYLSLLEGNFWPQWLSDADGGRGAPVFVFYPPLAYFIAGAFRHIAGSSVLALELTQTTALVLLYASSFRLFRLNCSAATAAALALLTCCFPAVLFVTLRVHMLAAAIALPAFPMMLRAVLVVHSSVASRILAMAFAVAWLAWSHLPSLMMAVSLAVLLSLLTYARVLGPMRAQLCVAMVGIAFGIAIGAAPLAPALFEANEVSMAALSGGNLDWRDNFLWVSHHGVDSFRADYPFLTLSAVASSIFALVALATARQDSPERRRQHRGIALTALFSLLLTSPLAWPLYESFWSLQALQFPWRWLPFASVLAMCAVASIVGSSVRRNAWMSACVAVAVFGYASVALGLGGMLSQRPNTEPNEERWMVEQMPRGAPEYRPRLLANSHSEYELADPGPAAASSSPEIRLQPVIDQSMERRWAVNAKAPGFIEFGVACFPGWVAYSDGNEAALGCNPRGLLTLEVDSGRFDLLLRFETTRIRQITRAVSLLASLVWLIWIVQRCVARPNALLNLN